MSNIYFIMNEFRMSTERTTGRVRSNSFDSVQVFQSKICSILYYVDSSVVTDVLSPFILLIDWDNHVFSPVTVLLLSQEICSSEVIFCESYQKLFHEVRINIETLLDPCILIFFFWCKRLNLTSFVLAINVSY